MKKIIWLTWVTLTLAIGGYYGYVLLGSEDKSELLIGEATHGHFQIEMACSTCHTSEFGGEEVLQNACTSCHAEELEAAHDSHPKKKFTDPREAYRLEIIDARYCVSCHTEHQDEQTRAMGVTLPDDFCYHCHKEVGDERESHKDLPFESCATSGCHNYHDNRALFETFLVDNANQPWLDEIALISQSNHAHLNAKRDIARNKKDVTKHVQNHPDIVEHWPETVHAQAGITCAGCHAGESKDAQDWVAKPNVEQCQACHKDEAKGFLAGKHGMRLAQDLSAMTPEQSQSSLSFNAQNMHAQQGCNTCHSAHETDTQFAATGACLTCHADEHSVSFTDSPHGKLWQAVETGNLAIEEGVSCATCHMPKKVKKKKDLEVVSVEHNQNLNLRPNEKMIRPVCMNCHSLEFSIDALADENLIKNNFNGKPGTHIESIDWALKRSLK